MATSSSDPGLTLPGVSSTSRPAGIAIAPSVIDHGALVERWTVARREVQAGSAAVGPIAPEQPGIEIRAEQLHRLCADIGTPARLDRVAGVRGHVAFQVKRVVRKLIRWYVDGSGAAQKEFDAELVRLASETASTISSLERRIGHLEDWNDQLLRRVRRLERAADAGRAP